MARQAFVFGLTGLAATGIQYLILHLLVVTVHARPPLASAVGYATSALMNYFIIRRLVFRSNRRHLQALPRFVAVASVGLTLNTFSMALVLDYLPIHYLLAQVMATMVVFAWNFLANRFWTFASK